MTFFGVETSCSQLGLMDGRLSSKRILKLYVAFTSKAGNLMVPHTHIFYAYALAIRLNLFVMKKFY